MRHSTLFIALLLVFSTMAVSANDMAQQIAESKIKPSQAARWPAIAKAIGSKTDSMGDMSMRQPNGPSYEFFANLMPPLKYVDAPFHHYPIVLSPPNALVKARYISNGSGVNALARQINWRGETGIPVFFHVGDDSAQYGGDLRHLDGPHYLKGYLPVVQNRYRHDDNLVSQEAFCSTSAPYADNGVVFVRFSGSGLVTARIELSVDVALQSIDGVIRNSQGEAIVWTDGNWKWEPGAQRLATILSPGKSAVLAVFTKPMKDKLPALTASVYDAERIACIQTWDSLLSKGMQVETPEPVVNDAWRSLLVGTFELMHGDEVRYSAGNQYAKMYVGEGGDTIRAFALWGFNDEARRLLIPLMDYKREGLLYHQAGKKLQLLTHYYQLTGDATWFQENRERWMLQANRLLNDREPESGLTHREQYCGDIATPVYSLNTNANAWSGLRDFAVVMEAMGDHEMAQKCAKAAEELKPATLAAVTKSEFKNTNPPFIPMALFGEEQPYDPLTSVRLGGYWDLMAPYVLGSGIFAGTEREDWMLRYLQEKGGLMMGMVRTHPGGSFWIARQNIDDLYTLRYVMVLLRRDEVERALVSFYGKLAQGFTRDTFIGAEGTCPMPLDEFGRQMYLPPNSASNAFWLWMLRYTMIQDWDLSNDGTPDTLRLMFATPKRWMEDGKTIKIERAPTAFGEVSVSMQSHLKEGEIIATVTAPSHAPEKMLLRARIPDGWKVVSAKTEDRKLAVDKTSAVDISGMTGKFSITFGVSR